MLDDVTADEATIRGASFVRSQTAARSAKRPQACWPRGLEIRRATPITGLGGGARGPGHLCAAPNEHPFARLGRKGRSPALTIGT